MKSIKKIGKTVAASALLVGATLTGAAGMAAAQSSGSSGTTLGDYPHPFVDQDGNVDSTIVVGDSAKTIDVVGAVNIAGSLGQDATKTEEKTVDVEGSAGWSAMDGVTLNTRNDQLYFGEQLTEVRDTLTEDQLPSLEETQFQDEGGDETDIEYFLYPGTQSMTYGKPDDRDDEDPIHYVDNPEGVDNQDGNYLFRLQANMEDEIEFNASDVTDEEIELFGRTYTVGTDTDEDELILLGSQTELSVDSGQSKTFTVDDNEHTIEVVGVTTNNEAVFRLDGTQYSKEEEQTVSVDGQEVRVREINNFGDDSGVSDNVEFAIGSEEIRLSNGESIEDENEDEVDGTYVVFNGDDSASGQVDELSSIDIYVGSNDDDMEYVMAGESYSHPLFENFEFHFGGLNPNVQEDGESENIAFGTNGDDTATVSYMTESGDSTTLEFANGAPTPANTDLSDDDGDIIHVFEGIAVQEDEYFTSDAGDFSHIWEVTNIDRDSTSSFSSDDEATVDLKDAATDDQVEVDLDYASENSKDVYEGTEVIDGHTYKFELNASANDPNLYVAWGDGSSEDGGNHGVNDLDVGDAESLYPALDTQSGAAVVPNQHGFGPLLEAPGSGNKSLVYELPTTESTDEAKVNITIDSNGNITADPLTSSVSVRDGGATVSAVYDKNKVVQINGGLEILFHNAEQSALRSSSTDEADLQTHVLGTDGEVGNNAFAPRSVAVIQPENDDDEEESYIVGPGYDTSEEEITYRENGGVISTTTTSDSDGSGVTVTGSSAQDGEVAYPGSVVKSQLESNDDVLSTVDIYGAYSELDEDEQGSFDLWQPMVQATEGVAFTANDGGLSASMSSSGSVTSMMPTGWPDAASLDSDSNIGQLKNNENLILVGGPAVNNLVSELATENKTWTGSQYTQGQGIVQLVEDAFTDGNHALVVAGFSGEDTRAASNFIANYADHSDSLEGETMVEVDTQSGEVVE